MSTRSTNRNSFVWLQTFEVQINSRQILVWFLKFIANNIYGLQRILSMRNIQYAFLYSGLLDTLSVG